MPDRRDDEIGRLRKRIEGLQSRLDNSYGSQRRCFKCGRSGHLSRYCNIRQGNGNPTW